ncbi:MAG: pyruvate kinase [Deltaproteobacteria bacterium]|nr:pyruvate kinase [Deltaproteobacteria bacterium]
MRNAKILGTLGPASANEQMLSSLFRAGLDAVRLNFSHGTADQHRANALLVRSVAASLGRTVAILGDLCGPKIRCGTFANGPITLVEGARFTLTHDKIEGSQTRVSMSYPLANDLRVGDVLLLDDGLIKLRVESVLAPEITTVVEVGGELSDKKGINIPGVALSVPSLTPKDEQDIALGIEIGVDFFAMSFVRNADDVRRCKSLAGTIPVIAKLEKPEAVDALDEIIEASDGVMVARGDMGVEMGSEKVPLVQKRTIKMVNAAGKLVITATQMLDSMIRNPRPTRAEAADIANAVLDGTDVLMLSGEMASGKYPLESVQTMDTIIREIEGSELFKERPEPSSFGDAWAFHNVNARAAALASRSISLKAIVVATRDGFTANVLADYRPHAPILAITPSRAIASRLSMQWGVKPVIANIEGRSQSEILCFADDLARLHAGAVAGDAIAVLVGSQSGEGRLLVLRHVK